MLEEGRGGARGRAAARLPVRHRRPNCWVAQWAYEDRLVDLEGVLGPVLDLFDADAIEASTLLDGKTGRRGLYALPMGRYSNHVHVWNSLLERAGFTLADIPKEWEAFWSFWCDRVQPAVRKALGRDDIWGVGLPMSAAARRHRRRALAVPARLRRALARPRPPASDRRSRGAGGDHQGAGRLHRRSGARAARRPTRRAGPTSTTTRRSSRRPW